MVAETCSGNWIKDARPIVCSGKCWFGRFLGKVLVALKNYFSLQFSLILGIHNTDTRFMYIIYIWGFMLGL